MHDVRVAITRLTASDHLLADVGLQRNRARIAHVQAGRQVPLRFPDVLIVGARPVGGIGTPAGALGPKRTTEAAPRQRCPNVPVDKDTIPVLCSTCWRRC